MNRRPFLRPTPATVSVNYRQIIDRPIRRTFDLFPGWTVHVSPQHVIATNRYDNRAVYLARNTR